MRCPVIAFVILAQLSLIGQAQEAQKPGKEHDVLKDMVGTWDAVVQMPGSPDSKALAIYTMSLEGMWLTSDFHGKIGEQKFHGKSFDSWDSAKKKYVGVWMDSMTGSPMVFEGNFDESGKTLVMHAESVGPDGKKSRFKSTSVNSDANHHLYKMFMLNADGSETEVMSIRYTRRTPG